MPLAFELKNSGKICGNCQKFYELYCLDYGGECRYKKHLKMENFIVEKDHKCDIELREKEYK